MNNISDIDNLTLAIRRREFQDGLMDFVYGVTFLVFGLLGWLFFSTTGIRWYLTALVLHREVTIVALLASALLFILLIFGVRRLVENFRRDKLWKERGFVKSLRWQVSWPVTLTSSVVAILMILITSWMMTRGILSQESVLRALVSSSGVALGIVYFGTGNVLKIERYKWVGIIGGVVSGFILGMPISFSAAWLVFGGIWLVVLSLSGLWAFRQVLQAKNGATSE